MMVQKLEKELSELKEQLASLKKGNQNKAALIIFSGDLDKQIAAFNIATGAAASGMEVVMFFTFWGISALRHAKKKASGKDLISRVFGWMLPKGMGKIKLSQKHFAGVGTHMIKRLMEKKRVPSLYEMLKISESLGVRIYVCQMSMGLMGFQREEMIDYDHLKYCGVATFIAEAKDSQIQLFIS
ncbi:MAG: NADH dehydrogenase FAD-containing subunit [Calditrichaeota bacterium]|nr:NADH dehydrogenase FAD-containing subunit [Calditrichota bacterium]